jgi:hypothetical protein
MRPVPRFGNEDTLLRLAGQDNTVVGPESGR